jgi:hypothetical protein
MLKIKKKTGTWKNFRFSLRSSLFTKCQSVTKLMCSTFQPWCCIVSLMTSRRDTYWFSVVDLVLIRYRSQTSDTRLYSRIQKVSVLFPTGGTIVSLFRPVTSPKIFLSLLFPFKYCSLNSKNSVTLCIYCTVSMTFRKVILLSTTFLIVVKR